MSRKNQKNLCRWLTLIDDVDDSLWLKVSSMRLIGTRNYCPRNFLVLNISLIRPENLENPWKQILWLKKGLSWPFCWWHIPMKEWIDHNTVLYKNISLSSRATWLGLQNILTSLPMSKRVPFQTIHISISTQFNVSTQFNYQKHFYFKQFSLVKQF